jgi:site-specific DNA-methyltransferase (adenine-specific)
MNKIIQGDCLEVMKDIPDKSIDMILADLPYGTTACKWDTIIPFEPLWEQYKRIIKDNGAIVLTASQPFTSALVMSNVEMFKYEWVWDKCNPTNFVSANKQPLKYHENVLVFSKKQSIYNPQKYQGKINHKQGISKENFAETRGNIKRVDDDLSGMKFPKSIVEFSKHSSQCGLHPTQKPIALFEYLIKTYTNEGDIVLDNVAGSGTTGVACKNLNRNYILIEKEPEYIDIINKRLTL